MNYTVEKFTEKEVLILEKYFTNINKPVFGLINLPEVVKGALFARYSRSHKSLRRLFLDEFYTEEFDNNKSSYEVESKRAIELYDKMFLEYGDDSVAQLGGAHIACEQVSNILAKFIEKGRIAAYLEQSTRYVFYNHKIEGKYKYIIPKEIKNTQLLNRYNKHMSNLFDTYTNIINQLIPILKSTYKKTSDQTIRAWENTIKAKACDIVRGLLPASTKTNLGIYANGQTYEYLLIKMFASENQEIRDYASMMLNELRKIIPSFLTRVDKIDRGIAWSNYLTSIQNNMKEQVKNHASTINYTKDQREVELIEWDKNALDRVVADALYEYSYFSLSAILNYTKELSISEKLSIVKSYLGHRCNRRHKPGRATENIFYKFDIVSDYGAFRDLQRHRMLTIQWQKLTPDLGHIMPTEFDKFPELKKIFNDAVNKCKSIYYDLKDLYGPEIAQYVVPFAYKMHYSINMNLREAFHLIELRTQKQGHPSYRKVCLDMVKLIEEKAGHDFFTKEMNFVDYTDYDFAREDSEKNIDIKSKKM